MNESPQHILELRIEQVKRITAFHAKVSPEGLVIIAGRNGHGKSSVLDGLEMLLTGKITTEPIRRGSEEAKAVGETEDYVVQRTFTPTKSYLTVRRKDGEHRYKLDSPQTVLREMVRDIAFDPLAFANMKPKERAEELLRICPTELNLAANASEIKETFENRTTANRDTERLLNHFNSLAEPEKKLPAPVDIQEINAKLDGLRAEQYAQDAVRDELGRKRREAEQAVQVVKVCSNAVDRLENELAKAKHDYAVAIEHRDAVNEAGVKLKASVDAFPDLMPEVTKLKESLATAGQVNGRIEDARRATEAKTKADQELAKARKEAAELDMKLIQLRNARQTAIQGAKFPVEGLSVSEDGEVLLDGLPFDNASTSQKLKVGIRLARASNPRLRLCIVRNGNDLDAENLVLVRDESAANGFQIWMERIVSDEPGTIQIVDGTNAVDAKTSVPAEASQ